MDNTKKRILYTAVELFSVRGYDGVSVRDISGALGITQSALYKHYKSKRDIFESIVKEMETRDYERAKEYKVPEDTFENLRCAYGKTEIKNLAEYAFAQFRYWTEDSFASAFRKMLTLEQYKSEEMAKLYNDYLTGGVIGYLADIFREISGEKLLQEDIYYQRALGFFSPIFILMCIYDNAEDKIGVTEQAKTHILNFLNLN